LRALNGTGRPEQLGSGGDQDMGAVAAQEVAGHHGHHRRLGQVDAKVIRQRTVEELALTHDQPRFL
jgi:hypothetical protein